MQIGRRMAGRKADGSHARPAGCLDAEDRIFDNRATLWVGTKALGGQQKEIGCGFAGGDLDSLASDTLKINVINDPPAVSYTHLTLPTNREV